MLFFKYLYRLTWLNNTIAQWFKYYGCVLQICSNPPKTFVHIYVLEITYLTENWLILPMKCFLHYQDIFSWFEKQFQVILTHVNETFDGFKKNVLQDTFNEKTFWRMRLKLDNIFFICSRDEQHICNNHFPFDRADSQRLCNFIFTHHHKFMQFLSTMLFFKGKIDFQKKIKVYCQHLWCINSYRPLPWKFMTWITC